MRCIWLRIVGFFLFFFLVHGDIVRHTLPKRNGEFKRMGILRPHSSKKEEKGGERRNDIFYLHVELSKQVGDTREANVAKMRHSILIVEKFSTHKKNSNTLSHLNVLIINSITIQLKRDIIYFLS